MIIEIAKLVASCSSSAHSPRTYLNSEEEKFLRTHQCFKRIGLHRRKKAKMKPLSSFGRLANAAKALRIDDAPVAHGVACRGERQNQALRSCTPVLRLAVQPTRVRNVLRRTPRVGARAESGRGVGARLSGAKRRPTRFDQNHIPNRRMAASDHWLSYAS